MNVWFGTDWGAPVCRLTPQVAVPIGQPCVYCTELIAAVDNGIGTSMIESVGNALAVGRPVFYHLECWVRSVVGSVGHQLKVCPCFGGTYDCEPEGMSRREAAQAAYDLARTRRHDDDQP